MRRGVLQASLAYVIWGLFPLYFRLLHGVVALEVLAHRVVWSLAFLVGVLTVRRQWGWLGPAMRQPRVLGLFLASSALIGTNWYVYIWAVSHGRVVDASLGYFITPLVNVLTGWLVLKERLTWNYAVSFALIFLAVWFAVAFKPAAQAGGRRDFFTTVQPQPSPEEPQPVAAARRLRQARRMR